LQQYQTSLFQIICSITKFVEEDIWRLILQQIFSKTFKLGKNSYKLRFNTKLNKISMVRIFFFYEVQYTIVLLFIQDGRPKSNHMRIVYGGWLQLIWMCFSLQTLFAPILCMFSCSQNVEFGSQYLYQLIWWKHTKTPKFVITNKSFYNYFWIEYGHYILDFFF
jgi:hypothetical protein